LESFLKRSVPAWLELGDYEAVALWMKPAYWRPGDDPIDTLLKCYDYRPGVAPPEYA
jgi:hypothetical protein